MSDEKYIAENFDYQYRGNKIVNDLKAKVVELESEVARLKQELSRYEGKCECNGELVLDKELNSDPKMLVYNCNDCHKNVTRRKANE